MFIEMKSYVGDVLGYYIDDTLRESLITTAQDRENIFELSKMMGYRPKVTSPSTTNKCISISTIKKSNKPHLISDLTFEPDTDYYLRIKEGMELDDGVQFRTTELLDFNVDDRETTVYERDGDTNNPRFYLVKKYVDVISSEERKVEVTFSNTQEEYKNLHT